MVRILDQLLAAYKKAMPELRPLFLAPIIGVLGAIVLAAYHWNGRSVATSIFGLALATALAQLVSRASRRPTPPVIELFVLWSVAIAFVAAVAFSVTAVAFGYPAPLREFFLGRPQAEGPEAADGKSPTGSTVEPSNRANPASDAAPALRPQPRNGPDAAFDVGMVSGTAGYSVDLPVSYRPGVQEICTAGFDLDLPAELSLVSTSPGPLAIQSNKSVASNGVNGGKRIRVLVIGTMPPLGQGIVAVVRLAITSNAPRGPKAIGILRTSGSTCAGDTSPVTGNPGTVYVDVAIPNVATHERPSGVKATVR